MRLHQSVGPNPRVVTMFVAEKGPGLEQQIERRFVDVPGGENRRAPFTDLNPFGQTPLLEVNGDTRVSESVAICEYLEERQPDPPLIGSTAEERAETRMLVRRVDFDVVMPLTTGFRGAEGLPIFKDRMRCMPEGADGLKAAARDGMAAFDARLGSREWIAGPRYTLADILLFAFLDFGRHVGQPVGDGLPHLTAWFDRMAARPAAATSADPKVGLHQPA